MKTLKNDVFLKALRREPVPYTPIWIMRQAGRYLPEYRDIRSQTGDFLTLCKSPELATRVTLQPLKRFPLDAAILFSDILTIPDAMGLGLSFTKNEGPKFSHQITTQKDVSALSIPDPYQHLSYVLDAIKNIKHELAGLVPLIGFCGSPWTVGAYMVVGKPSQDVNALQQFVTQDKEMLHALLNVLTQAIAQHLVAQIESGVDVVMLFDTWGSLLGEAVYFNFSLPYLDQIVKIVKSHNADIPVIVFTKGAQLNWLNQIAATGCDCIGLDWTINLGEAKHLVGDKVALQGNLNPELLKSDPQTFKNAAGDILESFGHGTGHIFNLGHGITPDIQPNHVAELVDYVHAHSQKYHD